MAMLAARNLSKTYRAGTPAEVRALQDVTLDVPEGSLTLLSGPSGSGKTTLMALLGGLERPTSGSVLFAERDLSACSDVELARLRRRMGFVFQDFALIPGLPAWENVAQPLIPRGVPRRDRVRIASQWLTRFGLSDKSAAYPGELSGGEQQRVALARAMAGNPEVVLADEPTSNLDDDAARAVMAILYEMHAEGKTVVLSSHDWRLDTRPTQVRTLMAGRLI